MAKGNDKAIEKQLQEVTKVTRAESEDDQDYLGRIYIKANTLSDDEWAKLDEPTQKWVNAAAKAADDEKDYPMFDGTVPKKSAKAEKKSAKANGKEPKAAKKAAAKGGEKKGESRGRKGLYPLDAKITVKAKENPHRAKSKDFGKFKGLKTGATVEKALEAGADWGYLRYAEKREIISISK